MIKFMKRRQAKAGGETGINGEHYKGGQFLPDHKDRGKQKRLKLRRVRKVEIEPYVWVESDKRALWSKYEFLWVYDRETGKVTPNPDYAWNRSPADFYVEVCHAAELYNSGERFVQEVT